MSATWAWLLNRTQFNWWSVPLWIFAGLMALAAFGHFVDRDVPPGDDQAEHTGAAEEAADREAV